MSPRSSQNVSREGVHAVGQIFERDFGWFFREQYESDFGIDAQVETTDEKGNPSGKLLALQIKSGSSYFRHRGDGYVYYGDLDHLEYWERHCLPVFIIFYNPETGLTLWQKIERRLATIKGNRWSIVIPHTHRLETRFKKYFRAGIADDEEAVRRFRFSTDAGLMEQFRDREVFFRFNVWVNKTLNIRGISVYYDDWGKEQPDVEINVWAARGDVDEIMNFYFPWLGYEYADDVQDISGEIETHTFFVQLNRYATSYLELEKFYADGPEIPEDIDKTLVDDDE